MTFENKLVAIINKKTETGVAMNALAHMGISIASQVEKNQLKFNDYQDKNSNIYPSISQLPFIILRGKNGEIKKAIQNAKQMEIKYSIFTNTMTGGTYQEQLANTANTPENEIVYYGLILFGEWEKVNEITKKFSLYK